MAVINLRNVPDALVWRLKSEALGLKVGFHEYCLQLLEREALPAQDQSAASIQPAVAAKPAKIVPPKETVYEPIFD